MKYKGYLLDLDNTLYEYSPAHQSALKAVSDLLCDQGVMPHEKFLEQYQLAKRAINQQLVDTASSHNRLLYFQKVLEKANKWDPQLNLQLYRTYWNTFINSIKLSEDALNFLKTIKGNSVCIVTDLTADVQMEKMARLNLTSYAKYMVTSEEVGAEKPHPKMFLSALAKLGCEVNEVCMVGDDYRKDIVGASKLGIDSYWLIQGRPVDPDSKHIFPINNLSEVLGRKL